MTDFPHELLVNVPSSIFLTGGCEVVVRLQHKDDIARLRAAYGQRLHHVVIHEKELGDIAWLSELLGLRVEIVLGDGDTLSNDAVEVLNTMQPLFRLDTPVGLFRNINLLASLGYPVMVNAFDGNHGMEPVTRALSYYLHNPLLNTPIEPFHSIMRHFLGNGPDTLWSIFGEVVGRNAYVSELGEISVAQRWILTGLCFGTLNDTWEKLVASGLYRRLVRIRDGNSASAPPCVSCPHRDTCGGFLRGVNVEWPCEVWQKIFADLRNQGRQVMGLTEWLTKGGCNA
ncbi:MAG: hypothetical protein IT365_29235 [Candidatus Hydrogenedentes bacterium]|nr:hypothetical protein [Candidatus Hydrogenedentota bacterium]